MKNNIFLNVVLGIIAICLILVTLKVVFNIPQHDPAKQILQKYGVNS